MTNSSSDTTAAATDYNELANRSTLLKLNPLTLTLLPHDTPYLEEFATSIAANRIIDCSPLWCLVTAPVATQLKDETNGDHLLAHLWASRKASKTLVHNGFTFVLVLRTPPPCPT